MEIIKLLKNGGTPELSYYLGLFWADGYCRKDKECLIEIVEDDGLDIEPILKKVYNFKIYKRSRKNRKNQMTYYIYNKEINDFFKNNGKYSNSFESHEKILNHLTDECKIYFIKGLIDGDGCFYFNQKHYLRQFSLCSNYNQNWEAIEKIFLEYKISYKIKRRLEKSGNSSFILVSDKNSMKNLINLLYFENIKIDGLHRKKDKALQILNSYKNV